MNATTSGNPWVAWYEAAANDAIKQSERLAKMPLLWDRARQVRKGATPTEEVYSDGKIRLLHYHNDQPPRYQTPLVFCFALVNRPYILDLKDGRSVVRHFLDQGFDTYLIDWGRPTRADRFLTLDDYVNGHLADIVDVLRERHDVDSVNLLGYCMGGTMSAIFSALHPDRVRNLILLAAGIDFSTREGLLNLWTDPKVFDVDAFVDAFGNCPAEFLQASFLLLKPVQNLVEKPVNFFENLDNDKFLEDFFTMETWLNDNIPVAGEVFREFVKHLYQQNLLVQNKLPVGKHIVDLRQITCPLLNIAADKDDLVPCTQSLPVNDLVGSTDRKTLMVKAGHIGLAIGGRAQRETWPQAASWLADRSQSLDN